MINNPEYKGEWKPKQIDNPAYRGEWIHLEIDNPEYTADDSLYKFDDIANIGFEIWQVKSGTIFDNIIVTDDIKEAEEFAKDTFFKTKEEERKMQRKKTRKQMRQKHQRRRLKMKLKRKRNQKTSCGEKGHYHDELCHDVTT